MVKHMRTGGYDYDTAEIRREARKIKRCCDSIAQSAIPETNKTRQILDGNFEGAAADALDARLVSLTKDIETLRKNLNTVYKALMRFADELERRDAELARIMAGK